MRYLRQFCAVATLLCAFSFSAYAGDIPCPAVTAEPPQATGEIPNNVAGEMQNGVESSSTLSEALLVLIQGAFLVV